MHKLNCNFLFICASHFKFMCNNQRVCNPKINESASNYGSCIFKCHVHLFLWSDIYVFINGSHQFINTLQNAYTYSSTDLHTRILPTFSETRDNFICMSRIFEIVCIK